MEFSTVSMVNRTLLAAIIECMPWISYKKKESGEIFALHGAMVNLLEHFKETLKIKFDYVEASDGMWGERLPNGSFNGMIGMVHRNEVHVAVGPFAMDYLRNTVVDFTSPLYRDPLSILVGKQNPKSPLFPFLQVFNGQVWLVLSSLLLTCILFYVFIGHMAKRRSKGDSLFSKAFMVFMAPLFNTYCPEFEKEGKTRSKRVLITFWKLGSRFISLAFSALLLSVLIVTKPGDYIKTFQDFEKFPESVPLVEMGTCIINFLKLSNLRGVNGILRKIESNRLESVLPLEVLLSNDTISKVLRRNDYFVIMEYSTIIKALHDRSNTQLPCGFHITSLSDFGMFYSFVVNKYLPSDLKESLTYLSINLVENGLMAHDVDRKSQNFDRCLQKWNKEKIVQINLRKLLGVFIFYFSGLLSAIIYFLIIECKMRQDKINRWN